MPAAAVSSPAVTNAVMTPAPDAATPIAQPARRKVSELTHAVNHGEMSEMAYDPAAAPANGSQGNPPRVVDAPLYSGDNEVEAGVVEDFTSNDAYAPGSIEVAQPDDSVEGEVVDPAEWARIKAEMAKPELAETMLEKLVTVPGLNGKPWPITVKECIRGYLRNEDYSNKTAELAEQRRAVVEARNGLMSLLTQMDSSEGFIQAARTLGKYGTAPVYAGTGASRRMVQPGTGLLGACYLIGEDLAADIELQQTNPAAYAERLARREQDRQIWEANQRALRAEQQVAQARNQQQQQPQQADSRIMHQLEQLMPHALRALDVEGLKKADAAFQAEYETNGDRLFQLHWDRFTSEMSQERLANGPDMELVHSVLEATVQSCQRRAAEMGRPVRQQGLPPGSPGISARGTVANQQGGNGAMPKRARIGDMGKLLGGK